MSVSIDRSGRVAVVRFDRGERLNALSRELMGQLTEAARNFEDDAGTSVVVLTGARAIFTAGLDLRDPAITKLRERPLAERYREADAGARMCRAWAGIEPVTIAAIEGPCMGGGVALSAMCDFRIGAEGSRYATPELRRGLNMAWHAVPRLIGLVNAQTTRRLVLAGHELDAQEAHAAGLIDALAAKGESLAAARTWADDMAGACPPVQLRMAKRQIAAGAHAFDRALSALDRDQFLLALASEDFAEALGAFRDKRKPDYKGE